MFSRPFPCSLGPLYQNEAGCSAFDMEMIFYSCANKTHFHKKGFERKWPIDYFRIRLNTLCLPLFTTPIPTSNFSNFALCLVFKRSSVCMQFFQECLKRLERFSYDLENWFR